MVDGKIFKRGYHINDLIEVQGQKLKIVGFLQAIGNPQDDSQIYITDDFVNDLYPGNNSYGMIVARVDIKSISQVVKNIERNLRKERNLEEGKEDFFVQSFDDMIKTYSNALNIVIGFILLIAFISVIVSAINTANTMITSVLERYKEIGIIKSIGARNSEVFKIFLFESSFLGFVAGSLGVLLGWMLSALAGSILKGLGWGFLQPKFSIWLFVGCITFATLTGAVSGVVPAARASKINPVDALRYE
jgi:putative ABC transport system permease protein